MHHHDRRLPHWDVTGKPLFVTFRLHGTLPVKRDFPPGHITSGRAFVALDRMLDQSRSGPLFLQRPEIAQVMVGALRDGEVRFHRYQLHAYVVMPNHVHMLVTPGVTARYWLGPLKGFTAYVANRILRRTGAFWQDESYDHLVRDEREFGRIRAYIENNPVKAGWSRWRRSFLGLARRRDKARRQAESQAPHLSYEERLWFLAFVGSGF